MQRATCKLIFLYPLIYIFTVKVKVKSLSHIRLFATPWTVAYQTPQSMEFSRQEYWSGLPSPSPGDLPNPGIEPRSPALQADALPSEPPGKPFFKAVCINPNLLIYPFSPYSLVTVSLFSTSIENLYFCFINKFIYTLFKNIPHISNII